MTIGELADAAGLSRRAIRFYVQRNLIAAPQGKGRGSAYTQEHLDRLKQIQDLQVAGHSLDGIKRILAGDEVPEPVGNGAKRRKVRRASGGLSAELWTRLRIVEGVELHFDASKINPEIEQMLELKGALRSALGLE